MKQLKIIADQYNSQYSVAQARFNESITLAPHSRIWLDKISMNILSSGGDGTYTIGAQTITFCPSKLPGTATSQYKTFIIPAGTYTLPSLLTKIQDGFNSSLNSNPAFNSIGRVCDLGLGFLVTSAIPPQKTNPVVSLAFVGATCERRNDALPFNFVLSGDTWNPTAGSPTQCAIVFPTGLLKGALLIQTSFYTASGTMGTNECKFGLYNPLPTNTLQYGIQFEAGVWSIVNGANTTAITNQAVFNNGVATFRTKLYCFYIDPVDTQANGLRFGIIDVSGATPTILYTTPLGAFAGYTTGQNYLYQLESVNDPSPMYWLDPYITYQPNTLTDNVGTYIDFASIGARTYLGGTTAPSLTTYPVLPLTAPPVRNVVIKFVNSTTLAFGLGFGTTTLPTIVGSSGIITADNAVNFIDFIDLALDILNLPLATYTSSSGITGRTNTLSYFTPQPQNATSTSLYTYENKNITFIDINNEQPLVLEALQYRVYNPQDLNSYFVFANLSITMFISEPEEGADVRIASA